MRHAQTKQSDRYFSLKLRDQRLDQMWQNSAMKQEYENANSKAKKPGSGDIAGQIRHEIRNGAFLPMTRLPSERRLAETYGVARGTIRESLSQLEKEGLVEVRPGSGTYVRGEEPDEAVHSVIENARPLELIDARFALEPHMCRLAVLHASRRDLETAEAFLEKMEASVNDPDAFADTDNKFHTFLAEITGNSLLMWFVSQMKSVRNQEQWSHMRNITLDPKTIEIYNQHHRAIVEAIRKRDPEKAANAMKKHLEEARLSLTRAVSN